MEPIQVEFFINHLFLPPKLPQSDDHDPELDTALLRLVKEALVGFGSFISDDQKTTLKNVFEAVSCLFVSRDSNGDVNKERLLRLLRHLRTVRWGTTVPLHIVKQNACVLITNHQDGILFEAFEVSPLNKSVMSTIGRLRRCFPGPAIMVPAETFDEPGLQSTLAETLSKMSSQSGAGMTPTVQKSKNNVEEDRDTTHPGLVTELTISGFLMSFGTPFDTQRIWKNTREEVLCKNTRLPWRRSPLWLLLRVLMHLLFGRSSVDNSITSPGLRTYKLFMLYLLATVLEKLLPLKESVDPTQLQCMIAKIVRRMLKMDVSDNEPGISFVKDVLKKAHSQLEERWSAVQEYNSHATDLDLPQLQSLEFEKDVTLLLPDLDTFLASIPARTAAMGESSFSPSLALKKYPPSVFPNLDNEGSDKYNVYNLFGIENWVAHHLPLWLDGHLMQTETTESIKTLMQKYHGKARSIYLDNPETTSIMILTLFELWVACDKSAIAHLPLLKDYDPDIPFTHLRPLILPLEKHMIRLMRVEKYLEARRKNSHNTGPPGSIFMDFGMKRCFGVRFFDQSPNHQRLRESIETVATAKRKSKCEELARKKEKYRELMNKAQLLNCEYIEVTSRWGDVYQEHSGSCLKHQYLHQAKQIKIDVYEWPLPSDTLKVKSVVFELDAPAVFCNWRDATMFLINDVLGSNYSMASSPRSTFSLESYTALLPYFQGSSRRIGLLSEDKSHVVTHRRKKSSISSTTESDVCLNNGLKFRYYDAVLGYFVSQVSHEDVVPKLCTYTLPYASNALQKFLYRNFKGQDSTPNEVISTQSDCPDHMSFAEYRALASLTVGYKIQWKNILTQLSCPIIDLKKPETSLVILQAIYQAGPMVDDDNFRRSSHSILAEDIFSNCLLDAVQEIANKIKNSWESLYALNICISITCRQLSLTSTKTIRDKAFQILSNLRLIGFNWVRSLKTRHERARDEVQRTEFLDKVVDASLICCGTFDVDDEHLQGILSNPKDNALLLQCNVLIHDYNSQEKSPGKGELKAILYRRWQRFSYRAYPILAKAILQRPSTDKCLDEAVKACWPVYERGKPWKFANYVDHWVMSRTSGSSGVSQTLYYNLLEGSLLVNGLPLSRLPSTYEHHPSYQKLFGDLVFEIMPVSTMPGMRFSSKQAHEGHVLHFGVQDADLLVQATIDHHTFELIPKRVFQGLLPHSFVDNYFHWLDRATGKIHFRENSQPWKNTNSTWELSLYKTGWSLEKQEKMLIDPQSTTGDALTGIFASIQPRFQINIALTPDKKMLEIELPRLNLEFSLKRGTQSVVSRKLRGLEIDRNQSIGTLVGLKTKLVLRNPLNNERKVAIPFGNVAVSRYGDHVSVTISPNSESPHVYKVDEVLQRLTDNGSLLSKLFLCYLHGLTAFCLPDPLTDCTGTEQALLILKNNDIKSFPTMKPESWTLLGKIDSLTPRREYYPAHEEVMQIVDWDSRLPVLSQHPHFHLAVKELIEQKKLSKLYYPEEYVQPVIPGRVNPKLLRRDSSRSSTFRISCFGAEDFTRSDVVYSSRDRGGSTERAKEAQIISAMVFHRNPVLHRQLPGYSKISCHILSKLKTCYITQGPENPAVMANEFAYDAQWLQNHAGHWAKYWCWMHKRAQRDPVTPILEKFRMTMWFATMAFAPDADLDTLHTAAGMFIFPEMKDIQPVAVGSFALQEGDTVNRTKLRNAIETACLEIQQCPEQNLPKFKYETKAEARERRKSEYRQNKEMAVTKLCDHLSRQFPIPVPTEPTGEIRTSAATYISISQAMREVAPLFNSWYQNWLFMRYLEKIEGVMNRQDYEVFSTPALQFKLPNDLRPQKRCFIGSVDLFTSTPPAQLPDAPCLSIEKILATGSPALIGSEGPRLESLVQRLEDKPGSTYEQQYSRELRQSLDKLYSDSNLEEFVLKVGPEKMRESLDDYLSGSEKHVQLIRQMMITSIQKGLGNNSFAVDLSQSPRISSKYFLQQLSKHGWAVGGGWDSPGLPAAWKRWIIGYGMAVTKVQRARRMIQCLDKKIELIREIQNEGHTNWNPSHYPESLLIEIENNIMIRAVQEDIAKQMRSPPNMENSVMQLNMGEGKSSVIVPIVTVALADGSRLVRVVVAKPQSRQMFHMLMSTLGGMVNRRIFHLPFSRFLRLTQSDAMAIAEECQACMDTGGVMLVQPEHILSFKLMGLESPIAGKEDIARCLLQTQQFFDNKSRDIVDESDENFSVKFELIYTMGRQCPINAAPDRWVVIQTVLEFVRNHTEAVVKELPDSIELHQGHVGGFPRLRLLKQDATTLLFQNVAETICTQGFPGFPISRQGPSTRQAVLKYITQPVLSDEEITNVEEGTFWTETTKNCIMLLRGLFAKGILPFIFGQKRWRVNYGLDNTRQPPTKLAVPYRAKDSPTPRSEFSHPDVVIILTCNCYYYQGLNDEDMFLTFDHLVASEEADDEYQQWTRDSVGLPTAFRQLMGVNLKDTVQCKTDLFPHFRHVKRTIDYFLQHIVFPKCMKEFPQKLSASGWDLGAVKPEPTTGFSGTIDSRKLLPLDVSYLDLPEQKHTNARVLEYLLRPENGVLELSPVPVSTAESTPGTAKCRVSDAEALLEKILAQNDSRLRVILDVGAQILELTNAQVAKTWLQMVHARDKSVQAAIYFDDHEEIMVLDTRGTAEPFRTSSYLDQLDVCLVFLDEAHTRGTDLKLPDYYRAAVTLGANLTKDRLIQACMRMRKLGKGQSVVFCVPQEIRSKIQELESSERTNTEDKSSPSISIGVPEVLRWAISETISDLRKSMPLWATQGQRFLRQQVYWDEAMAQGKTKMTPSEAEKFLEEEAQTLDQRYRPRLLGHTESARPGSGNIERLQAINARCVEVGSSKFDEATLQEEQERELSPEIEEERQIERPEPAEPETHQVHKDLKQFVVTGVLSPKSRAVMPAFESLRQISATEHIDVGMFPRDVLVTADFARTVKKSTSGPFLSDSYQRQVQWILTSQPRDWDYLIIISPHEAQELLPEIERSKNVTLHLYSARPSQEIKPLDELDLYTIPPLPNKHRRTPIPLHLKVQLNIFAGQLYFKSSAEYVEACKILRLLWKEAMEGTKIGADGFIHSSNSQEISRIIDTSTFSESPVQFLKVFLSKTRRDCQSINKTHLGRMLDGDLLQYKDFDGDSKI